MRKILWVAAALALSPQVACVSMSSLQTAETLEKGKTQSTFGGGYYSSEETTNNSSLSTKLPYLEYSYREGLAKDFDAGVKLTIIGSAAVDAKYRLYDGEAFDFSVGGAVGYMSLKTSSTTTTATTDVETTIIDFMIPVYASYRFDKSWAVYATPRYVLRMNSQSGASGGSSTASLFGGAGGLKIGNEWGAYLEAAYQKQAGSDFDLMQYNVSFFWETDDGILGQLF